MSRIPSRARPLTVGVVGLGVIGRQVCRALDAGLPGLRLAGATARTPAPAQAFLASLATPVPLLSLDDLVAASEVVVEASSQAHLQEVAPRALGAGRDLVVLSCGALLGRDDWIALAEQQGSRILVPSGAIGGLDAVKGGAVGAITAVTMESRKAPAGWAGAPWVVQQKIDLGAIREETLLFEGPASEACPAFPANVNVLAALSLAGIGPERTTTRIYAVPGLARNTHRVRVEGEFGSIELEVRNVPSENPRTGRLSYLSTIALLRDLGATVRVGT
jgi:aspartate dehydrogenase